VRLFATLRSKLLAVVAASVAPFLLYAALNAARERTAAGSSLGNVTLARARATSLRVDDGLARVDQLLDSAIVRQRRGGSFRDSSIADVLASSVTIVSIDSAGQRTGAYMGATSRADSIPVLRRVSMVAAAKGIARKAKTAEPPSFIDEGGVRTAGVIVPPVIVRSLVPPAVRCNCAADVPGAMIAVVSDKALQSFLAADSLPDGGIAVLLNATGAVLGTSGNLDRWINYDSPDTSAIAATGERDGVVELHGRDQATRTAGFAALKNLPWRVFVGIPRATGTAVSDNRLGDALLLGLLALTIAGIGAVLVSRAFSSSLQAVVSDIKRLAAGARIGESSAAALPGELGSVGKALNALAAGLEEREGTMHDDLRRTTQIFEQSPIPMWVADASTGKPGSGRIVQANEAAARLFGVASGALIGQRDDELFDPASSARLLAPTPAVIDGAAPEVRSGMAQLRSVNAESRERMVTVTHAMQDRFPARIVTVLDAGPATPALASGAVRALSAGPTSALTPTSSATVGEASAPLSFAANVADDFGEVFVGMDGFTQLAADSLNDPDMHAVAIERVRELTARGLARTRQLRSFAQGDALQTTLIDVNDAITHAAESMADDATPIEITMLHTESPAVVQADEELLHRTISELIVNARRAMPAGGTLTLASRFVEVTAQAARTAAAPQGHYVVLSVSDTGVGIANDVRRQMFEPFFSTRRDTDRGAGLGLAAVNGICKQHGWVVSVESVPKVGTAVSIYMPKAK
jgi:signal transduction histidine kinase